jgi:hypothetical protein
MTVRKQKFGLHCCALNSKCRGDIGWCWRLGLNTPWWHLGLALRPADRYVRVITSDPLKVKTDWTYLQRR